MRLIEHNSIDKNLGNRMTDATTWLFISFNERHNLVHRRITEMYQGPIVDGNEKVDVYDPLIETSDTVWSGSTGTDEAMFCPGNRVCISKLRVSTKVTSSLLANIFPTTTPGI